MKKVLLGATALTMLGAGGASASEWVAEVGGFMTMGIGYVDTEVTETEVEIVNNAEVIFNWELIADNGITFGAKIEIEGNGSDNNADEYVGFFEGSFGRVEIGAEDGAMDRLFGGPGGCTAFTCAGDGAGLLFDYAASDAGYNIDTDGEESGDNLKITYFTPRFSGFQAGVSYAPTDDEGGTSTDGTADEEDVVEIGANYANTFGDFSVVIGGGYTFGNDNALGNDDMSFDSYGGSVNVGFGGFSVGGVVGFTDFDDDEIGEDTDEDAGYSVGAGYATGPWAFGVNFAQGFDGEQEDQIGVSVGIDYALAPGVTVGAVGEYFDADDETTIFETPFDDDDEEELDDAFAFGVFMDLDF